MTLLQALSLWWSAPAPALSGATTDSVQRNPLTGLGDPSYDQGAAWALYPRPALTWQQLEVAYRQVGLARRVVDLLPQTAAAQPWRLDDRDERDLSADLDAAVGMQGVLSEWDSMARLYGGAVAVPYLEGAPGKLEEPLPFGKRYECSAVHVFSGQEVAVMSWNTNPATPGYRLPEVVQIQPILPGSGTGAMRVHASRFVWMRSGMRLPVYLRGYYPNYVDLPVLEVYWQALGQRFQLEGSAATLSARMDEAILSVPNTAQLATSGAGGNTTPPDGWASAIAARFARARSVVGVAVIDSAMTYDRKPASLGGFDSLDATTRRAVSQVEGYPQAALWGDPPTGLNADGDSARRSMARLAFAHQQADLQRPLLRLYRRIFGDELKAPQIVWPPTESPNATELATIRATQATADAAYVAAGILLPEEVRQRWTGAEYAEELTLDAAAEAGFRADLEGAPGGEE